MDYKYKGKEKEYKREYLQKYRKTAKGKEVSKKGREKYKNSLKGRMTKQKYVRSLRGKNTMRECQLKYFHSIDIDDYNTLLKAQHSRCAICFEPPEKNKWLVVDHDHKCCPGKKSCGKCIRGLLCDKCNTGIGLLGDSILVLQEAIRYLERQ
jgi:Recombination endonuclease VII